MRLSWNEIRARAAAFANEWQDAHYERGEAQSFYNEFFSIFGIRRRRIATFEEPVKKLGDSRGYVDLFWKGVLLVEQKSAGGNLSLAKQQALEYFPNLKEHELPRYVLVSDFQTFELYDLEEDSELHFSLADLPKHVESFGFILGVQRRTFHDQDPVNIDASEIMGRLHDSLAASGYTGRDLERFLVRLLFCLFADDTGIFEPRGIFEVLIKDRTSEDGSDLGLWLSQLFEVLNTPEQSRYQTLDEDLASFPYIDGSLFSERLAIPAFDSTMRAHLIDACEFNWDAISPAIFGALFQSVMNPSERRATGAHYTTEKNILKVVNPLFLDDLHAEFERLRKSKHSGRQSQLKAFHDRISKLRFLDPACGCGNFLIIAYRELRDLEIQVVRELYPSKQLSLDIETLSLVSVDQFFGIEIAEFPARIAETAMWMMDHIMNIRLGMEFGQAFVRIPLRQSAHIVHGDALEIEWNSVVHSDKCSFVFGNPPFVGAKLQTAYQRGQVRHIAGLGGSGGTLDYVAAWFLRAGEYIGERATRIGFVSTNSVTQGEQVAQLWPILFHRLKLEIDYAHRTFAWGSDARGQSHVHVVVIGLASSKHERTVKRLFSYADYHGTAHESTHSTLTAYLFDAGSASDRHLVVREARRPLNGLPKLLSGTQPIENGNLIFSEKEKKEFLACEPGASNYLKPFIGGKEYLYGHERWILDLRDVPASTVRRLPHVVTRLNEVKRYRQKSERTSTRDIADSPTRFNVEVIPKAPFLALPEVSAERREYVPIAWLKPPAIPSNKLRIMPNATVDIFGILTSRMHMSWLRHIGGRLESRYQYSSGVVFNTFPLPNLTANQKAQIRKAANEVLAARKAESHLCLSDMYDPDFMPKRLRKAHADLDRAVDRAYRNKKFSSDRERVEHIFGLYEGLIGALPVP